MADRSRQHENMPDRMMETLVVEGEEQDSEGVEQASHKEKYQSQRRKGGKKLADGDQGEPSHGEIKHGRDAGKASQEKYFEDHAARGQRPDNAQQRPAPGAAKADERERRVSAGDQKVDRHMVQDAEHALGFGQTNAVIRSRG